MNAEITHEIRDVWIRPLRPLHRWNCKGPCPKCGAKTSALGHSVQVRLVEGTWMEGLALLDGRVFPIGLGAAILPCRGCGRRRYARSVDGIVNREKPCNAKCQSAHGPACECSCGGKNHGSAFSL